MFGPPCERCGSEFHWVAGKRAQECYCGWPNKKTEITQEEIATKNLSFVLLTDKFKELVRNTSKTEEEEYYRLSAEEERLNADRYYKIIQAIAKELELKEWTTENIVQKVRELTFEITEKINRRW